MAETLRIATWNTHHGAQPGQQPTDFDAYIEACEKLADLDLDILGLQEVEKGVRRSNREDLTRIAAGITGMTPKFSRAMWYHGGQTGHSLLVRGKIINTRRVHLWGDWRHPIKINRRPVLWGGRQMHWLPERRNVLIANVSLDKFDGYELGVAHTHYGGEDDVRERSTKKALGALTIFGGSRPLVLLGDLNTPGIVYRDGEVDTDTASVSNWARPFGMEVAWRKGIATCGSRHIDHAVFRGLEVQQIWTENLGTSDHRALIVEAAL